MTTEQLLHTPRCGVCWRERSTRVIVLIDEVHDGSVRFHAIYDPSDARTLDARAFKETFEPTARVLGS